MEHEDQAILLALAADPGAEAGTLPGVLPGDATGEGETLLRLYTEAWGLLPYGLEPVAPAAGARGRLLLAVAGDETLELRNRPPAARLPVPPPASGPVSGPVSRAREASWSSREITGAFPARRPAPPAVARPRRWPLTLAAGLAFACLGLAGYLFLAIEEQKADLARIHAELRDTRARAEEAARLRESLLLVGSPGVAACALRPAPGAAQPAARGTLFVAADHQHWYLSVRGLRPAEPGRTYQLWFVADEGTVSAGTFDVGPDAFAELASETMPAGTRATVVTLERAGGAAAPTGPRLLYGEGLVPIA